MGRQSLQKKPMDDAPEDFEEIYAAHQPLIYRFMFWRTKDEMLAQDLTSSVFEKAWRTRASFTGGSAKAWLYRIARTTLIDHWRKKREVLGEDTALDRAVSDAPPLEEVLDQALAASELHRALTKLPPHMHRIVRLRFIEGWKVGEVANELNLSEANVRVIQYRALKKLRDYLQ